MYIHIILNKTNEKKYYIIVLDFKEKYMIIELFDSNKKLFKN